MVTRRSVLINCPGIAIGALLVFAVSARAERCKREVPFVGGPHGCSFCIPHPIGTGSTIKCLTGAEGYGNQTDCAESAEDGWECELNAADCGGDAYAHIDSENCGAMEPEYLGSCMLSGFLFPQAVEAHPGGFLCPEEDPE